MNVDAGGWVDENGNTITSVNYVEETMGYKYIDSIISMYLLSLGEFALDGYNQGYNRESAWVMYLLATSILSLLFMNFLIAIMAEPFERVKEERVQYSYGHKLEMIVDNIDLFNKKDFDVENKKYILVVEPEQEKLQ